MASRIFTVGHSTRAINGLVQLLIGHNVSILADVRSFPRSPKNPQFNSETFGPELAKSGIRYALSPKLGGRRKGSGTESKNTCWKNKSFRNYADYMETSSFREGIEEILQLSREGTVAIMCAEALYWRCHRSMIADFLKAKGFEVTHILDETHTRQHEYTQCAKIGGSELSYH